MPSYAAVYPPVVDLPAASTVTTTDFTIVPDIEYVRFADFGAGPGSYVDFARFSTHVPITASFVCAGAGAAIRARAAAQTKDPVVGTWVLNLAKSTYSPGPAPKSATRTYSMSGPMVTSVVVTVDAAGKSTTGGYTAAYDGKDYPLTGNATADMISLKRVNGNTVDASLTKGGKEMSHSHRVIAMDGKTMTITTTGTGAKGEKINNVTVFDRK